MLRSTFYRTLTPARPSFRPIVPRQSVSSRHCSATPNTPAAVESLPFSILEENGLCKVKISKRSQAAEHILKKNGFSWSRDEKCWAHSIGEGVLDIAKKAQSAFEESVKKQIDFIENMGCATGIEFTLKVCSKSQKSTESFRAALNACETSPDMINAVSTPDLIKFIQELSLSFSEILPSHIGSESFVATLSSNLPPLFSLFKKEELLVKKESLKKSLLCSATLGLVPAGAQQHSFLIPYKQEMVFIPGYRGLMDLIYRTGKLNRIEVQAVYRNDAFKFKRDGKFLLIEHKPSLEADRGHLSFVYATAFFKNNSKKRVVLSRTEIEEIKHNVLSRAGKDANMPWIEWFEEMSKVAAIRRLSRSCEMSLEQHQDKK